MNDKHSAAVSFQAHAELLQVFLSHRKQIVEAIQDVLNAQRKPVEYLQDRTFLFRQLEDCFFSLPSVTSDQAGLRHQLQQAHWASGFKPRQVAGLFNDIIDPAEMTIRAFHFWRQTRWPGRNGRVRYAHSLFNLYMVRSLMLASMRIWDADTTEASPRLARIQSELDALRQSSPKDQPALVRDARWLIPLAQSPTTDELAAYIEVAEQVAGMPTRADEIEIRKAHVVMIGGHLRSQIRHYCVKDGVTIDESSVVLRTRMSNALDFALLIQHLVPLLQAYERARDNDDSQQRLELASAICQGISPDPELFLNHIDLLGAYSMLEQLFVAKDTDGRVGYSSMGRRHIELLQSYEVLIERLVGWLKDDCSNFEPVDGGYSPYGAIFGTPTNLIEDMVLKGLQIDAETRFGLEDVFSDGGAEKLDWVNGWRKLPHVDPAVQKLYEYPQSFAEAFFRRIKQSFARRTRDEGSADFRKKGQLHVVLEQESHAAGIPELPARFVGSSDKEIVAAKKAEAYDETKLLRDRDEGYFAVSYPSSGGWVAIKKDIFTEVIGAGTDAKVVGLPADAADTLKLMCLDTPDMTGPRADSKGS